MPDSDLLPHILDLAAITPARLPQDARKIADLSLFDWMVVSLAGADQPLASIIRDFVVAEGGVAKAAVTGCKHRLPARAAALA
ncbi:MAG: MmgE/PrpD family protein, partial [Rhodospirillaceae bacterium]